MKRGDPSVGPGNLLSTIVGAVNDDGVVGNAELIQLVEKLANLVVVLNHAIGIEANAGAPLCLFFSRVQTCMRVVLIQTKNGLSPLWRGCDSSIDSTRKS